MVTNKENLKKLGKMITDRIPQKLGLKAITESDPEFWGTVNVWDDEMVEIALKMGKRHPMTLPQIAKATGKDPAHLEEKLQEMSCAGLLEYNRENPQHEKQWLIPLFVPGIAELFLMHDEIAFEHPEVADFFDAMTRLPLEDTTPMVPPGGAGIGMHVIPVEKAIPSKQEALPVEQISHWLDKYEGHICVAQCSCRRSQMIRGEGSGDVPGEWCINVGSFADYAVETGFGRYIDRKEAEEILQCAEENGYVHQITNIDGENKIFAICNCAPGVCYALRTSQLFNTPNLSRSAYTAHVTAEKCVACGKCVEVCPAGAVRLGQKLCRKDGTAVVYPKQELPDSVAWGREKWNPNYRDDNRRNVYDSGTAPCKTACPAHIAIQGYIKMASEGRYLDALKLIKLDNPFPAVCGSICNRRCEDACTRGDVDRALAIDEIKRFVAERELKAEDRYIPEKRTRCALTTNYDDKKIAVIGAGPAGMSCAYFLARMGYPVTVFDRNPAPGGMLTMGIPSFRLDRDVLRAEIDVLRAMGIEFRCGTEIGKDLSLAGLREEGYKAFYLAIGAQKSSPLGVKGEDLPGVLGGVDFLREVALGERPALGKRCAVVGGGNVAMDVCRTAARLGCEEVTVLYRRTREEMPADKAELAEAEAEGVKFRFLSSPVEILAEDGRVSGVKVEINELGEPDEKGRRRPVGTGRFEIIPVDSVIGAVGQRVDIGSIDLGEAKLQKNGTVAADEVTAQTGCPDIFAGGDCHTGPKFAIDAIAAGREGAESIHRYVNKGQTLTIARNLRQFKELDKADVAIPTSIAKTPRQEPAHDPAKAMSFENDRLPLTEEQVRAEAGRCLGCGASVVDNNRCIGCGMCTVQCRFDAIHLVRDHPLNSTMMKAEDQMKAVLPYAAKREVRIIKNRRK